MSRSPFFQDMIAERKITTQDFSGLAIQVEGNITAGKITVQASVTGRASVELPLENVNTNEGVPAATGIVAAGIYRVAVAALPQTEVVFSGDFAYTGALYVTGYLSQTLPPASSAGA